MAKKKNTAKKDYRKRWKAKHPEGRKKYSHLRRGHNCKWTEGWKMVNGKAVKIDT